VNIVIAAFWLLAHPEVDAQRLASFNLLVRAGRGSCQRPSCAKSPRLKPEQVQYRRCYSIDISWIGLIAFIMLPLRKFTESETQVREIAEDLSHFEPRRKHSRGYALAGQLLHQRRQETFFPIRNRAPRSQPAAIRMTCWRIKSPRVRKFLTRGQERGDSVGSHG